MKNTRELISVIVPVFNVEDYLTDCLKSLMAQTYSNFEVFLINDGSTDNSLSICEEFVAKDSRFRLISQNHQGLSVARNTGLKRINGVWFVFLDADDFISPYFLETMVEKAKDDIDMVFAKTKYIFENTSYRFSDWEKASNPEVITYSSEEVFPLFCSLEIRAVAVWNKLLRTDKYREITFPIGCYYEDVPTSYKYFLSSRKMVFIKTELYAYRKRPGSITSRYTDPKNRSDIIRVIQNMREEIKKMDIAERGLLSAFMFHNLASWYRNFVPLGFNKNKDIAVLLRQLNKEAVNNRFEISIYRFCPPLFHFNIKLWYKLKYILRSVKYLERTKLWQGKVRKW